jgi:hypothetical protein
LARPRTETVPLRAAPVTHRRRRIRTGEPPVDGAAAPSATRPAGVRRAADSAFAGSAPGVNGFRAVKRAIHGAVRAFAEI